MSYNPKLSKPVSKNSHFKTNYSSKTDVTVDCSVEPSLTKQEFKDECDINTIMAKYQFSGQIPNLNERSPQYIDTTGHDYQLAMNTVSEANSLFQELPSSLRNRFDNDPAQFLDFCSDDKNRDEMHELGLLKPVEEWIVPAESILNSAPSSE